MKYKDAIIDNLRLLGFELYELENIGYSFEYEGHTLFLIFDEKDVHGLRISLPLKCNSSEEYHDKKRPALHETSQILKYVKLYIANDNSLWATYEHYLVSPDNIMELLVHMIRGLFIAYEIYTKKLKQIEVQTTPEIGKYNN